MAGIVLTGICAQRQRAESHPRHADSGAARATRTAIEVASKVHDLTVKTRPSDARENLP